MEFEDFRSEVCKRHGKGQKKFKISSSWGIYDAYKHIRKNKWYDIGRPLTEHEFYAIVRGVNDLLAASIAMGETIVFPARMGKLELRKREVHPYINRKGKLKIPYPIDWNATVKLWFENEEAKEDKTLIRDESGVKYNVRYNKYDATYQNKGFYEFQLNRYVGRALNRNINKGITDTIW